MRAKTQIDPDAVYICATGVSARVEGELRTVARGTRLRGSDPLVKAFPEEFVPDGVPSSEWPSPFTEAIENARETAAERRDATPAPQSAIDPATKIGEVVICHDAILDSAHGPCRRGEVRRINDPIVAAVPQAFRPLLDAAGQVART